MTDPIRWRDAGGSATGTEQSLVRAGATWRMPSEQKHAIWSQILATLPPSGAGVPQATSPTASAPMLAIGKALTVVLVAAGAAIFGYRAVHRTAAPGPAGSTLSTANPQANLPPVAVVAMTTSIPAATSVAPSAIASTPTPHAVGSATPKESQLEAESRAILEARRALRSNDAAGAVRLLEQAAVRFKPGMLSEERAALMIEALTRSGNRDAAAARAKAFLRTYPKSPHAVDVQQTLAP